MEYEDYTDFFENIKTLSLNLHEISNKKERNRIIRKIISDSIQYSKENADSGDFFEAAEILYSAGELLEDIDYSKAEKLYTFNIKFWQQLIEDFKKQGKLHEIAEIELRMAEIYREKFGDLQAERDAIGLSIKYLKQESQLLLDFNEVRKLTQNYQNLAELYLKLADIENAVKFYESVIEIAKEHHYHDLLSYSYRQVAACYHEMDDPTHAKKAIIEGIEYFEEYLISVEEKSEHLEISQICQIIKILYKQLNDQENFIYYSKKEASAYIDLAERLEKRDGNFSKISRYYRGAALCYQEVNSNLLECASCFSLAGNYCVKNEDYYEASINFFDAANMFKDLANWKLAYKHFVKAGDFFWKIGDVYQSTENYLNAYEIAIEADLKFNRYGIFSQIVRGLNKVASEGLKHKEFYTAATLILESVKFYEQLDESNDLLLKEMVRNVYRYYYRAANLKKIGTSHIVISYVYASLSSLLIGKLDDAWKIISEVESDLPTIKNYKKMIELIIDSLKAGEPVLIDNFPFAIRRLIENSEALKYLLNLFTKMKILA